MVHPAILRQRSSSKLVWIAKKYHHILQLMARKEGCSITYLLNQILDKYFKKGGKKENE